MKHRSLLTILLCLLGSPAFATTQELLTNGGFEPPYNAVSGTTGGGTVSGNFPSGWTDNSRNQGKQTNNIYSQETTGTVSGSAFKAILAADSAGANPAPSLAIYQTMNAVPGRTLTASVWMKASANTTATMNFLLTTSPFTSRGSRSCSVTTSWQQFTLTSNTPATTETDRMEIRCSSAVTLWLDEASITVQAGISPFIVSPSGSDTTGDGSLAAPFQTIGKAVSQVYPSDTVQVRAGTYRETITPTQSGTANAPITIQNYNNEAVTVTGADVVAGPWTAGVNGVFTADVGWDLTGGKNNVFVDGAMVHEAREPNYGAGDLLHPATVSMTRDATNTNLITSATFSGKPDNFYAGARWHAGINEKWNWSAGTIGSSTGSTVTLSTSSVPVFTGAGAGYVYGLLSLLDADNEWFLQTNTSAPHTLSLRIAGQADPASHSVEMRRRTYTLDCNGKNYIVVRGLNLRCGDVRMNGTGDVLDRCEASHLSHFLTYGSGYNVTNGIVVSGTGNTVSNCTVHDTAGCGLLISGTGHLITRNAISNTDYSGTYSAGIALNANSSGHTVTFNTAHHSGRDILYLGGGSSGNVEFTQGGHFIGYNDFYEPGQMAKDLGCIYTYSTNAQGATGSATRIAYNWCHDDTVPSGLRILIYFDNWDRNYIVDHNVCWNGTGDAGIRMNGPNSGHKIYHNTLYNCDDANTHTFTAILPQSSNPDTTFFYTGATYAAPDLRNNLFLATTPDAVLTSSGTRDFRPKAGTTAIDSATLIAGYNDTFTGVAPDTGAYEVGGPYWVPGVNGWAIDQVVVASSGASNVSVTGATTTSATANGTLISAGTAATTVALYWGTSDGGTVPGAWGNVFTLGTNFSGSYVALAQVLANLTPGSTYSYRYRATNTTNDVWTDPQSFTTPSDTTSPTISGTFSPLALTTGVGTSVALPDYTGQAVTSDNIGVTSVTQSPAIGAALVAGTTHVTLTAHDAAGNTASAGFDVTVTSPLIVPSQSNAVNSDSFTDGSRSNTTGGDALGGVWYHTQTNAAPSQLTVVDDSAGIGSGNAMQLIPSADSHKALTFFSTITLANAGDGIEVSFDYRFATAPTSLGNGFRIGLYNSVGTRQSTDTSTTTTRNDDKGYMVRTNLGSAVADTAIVGEPAGDDILGGAGQITAVGTIAGLSANSGTSKHSMIFRITRQANGDLAFFGQIDGQSPAVGTHAAASAISYAFDEFAFGFAGASYRPSILVDNVVIHPVTAAPIVVLTAPASDALFASPSVLHLTATATSAMSAVTKVEFYHGTTKVGEDAAAPYETDWLNPAPGVHALTAVAYDDQGLRTTSAPVDIRVTGNTPDEFDTLRARWLTLFTGGNYNLGDADVAARVVVNTSTAQSNWTTMVKTGGNGRSFLWSDLASTTVSSQLSSNYGRLRAMALAYASTGSTLQGNASLLTDILGGLEWMYANRYNEGKIEYDNWFYWEIGVPLQVNDLAVLLYDQLTPTQLMNQMRAIERFTPVAHLLTNNAFLSTGANTAWKAQVVTVRGVVVKDATKMTAARDALSPVFPYVTSGDGFYTDGSFIQHGATPYNGAYGASVIRNLAGTLALTNGSSWTVTDPNLDNLYRWIYDSFAPFLFRGAFMDAVRGRDPARSVNQDHLAGHDVITSILAITEFAPPADAANFKAKAKAWIQADTFRSFISNASMPALIRAKAVLNDNSITPAAEPIVNKQFPGMDRAIHWRPGFAFAVSMCSSRIYNYESGLTENLRGWYSGDGATYLYNSDIDEYSSNFAPTVNPYRLAGITVDTQARTDGASKGTLSPKSWAGGAEIMGLYGSSGMELQATQSTLTARKSWFMFDNEVVALGSGITSTDNRTIETIVENRRLKIATSALTVDGVAKSTTLGWSETMTGVGWCNLAATGGYVFPGGATLKGLRETRTGQWHDISNDDTTTVNTNNFATLWFDHGSNPSGAGYSYILLPNQTAAQTAAYAASSDIVILENSSFAHAVRERNLGITAANFWEDGTHTVGFITVDKKSAVLAHETTAQVDISVSDPTQLDTGVVTVELARSATALVSADAQITVLQLTPTIRFTANVSGAFGRTIKASFAVPDVTPPTIVAPVSGFTPLTLTVGPSGTVALPDYTSQPATSDNIGVTSVTQSPAAGAARSPGTTQVTVTAFDAAGNMASTSFNVVVQDTTPPTISGTFSPLTLIAPAGLPDYTMQAATSDNVGVTSVTQSPAAGTATSPGVLPVTLTAHDAAGNMASTSFDVTVLSGDAGVLSFASGAVSANPVNGAGAPNLVVLTITRSAGTYGAVTVEVSASATGVAGATVGGFKNYTYGTEYQFASESAPGKALASFADGQTSATVSVQLKTAAAAAKGKFNLLLGTRTGGAALGTPATAMVTINAKDTVLPVIALTEPTISTVGASFDLTGTVKENVALYSFTVKLNGVVGALTVDPLGAFVANTNVAFSVVGVTPENGSNTLVIEAVDTMGNKATVTKTLTYTNNRPALAGTYNAILAPTGAPNIGTTGLVTATVTATGAFSGKAMLGGLSVPFSGLLNNAGAARFNPAKGTSLDLIDATEFASYLGALAFTVSDPAGMSGTLSTQAGGGSVLANFAGKVAPALAPVGLLNQPIAGPFTKGVYTVAFPSKAQTPPLDASAYPQGDGFATLTLSSAGAVTLAGNLADGTKYIASSKLRADGSVPLFTQLYRKLGGLGGEVAFADLTNTDVSGAGFTWLRPASPGARFYPPGFTLSVDAIGAKYASPASLNFGQGAADATNGNAVLGFSGGLLSSSVSKTVSVDPLAGAVKLIPTTNQSYALSLTTSSGLFSGTFTHTDGTSDAYRGILLNKGANKRGFGYFVSTPSETTSGSGQGGRASLTPGPGSLPPPPPVPGSDVSAPTIAFTAPTTSTVTGAFDLTGTVKENVLLASFSVKLNGVALALTTDPLSGFVANTNRAWSVAGVAPENGTNTIVVEAIDTGGNKATATKTLTYVNNRPELVSTYNALLTATGAASLNTTGLVSVTVTSTGAFTGKVTLGSVSVACSGVLRNDGAARFKPSLGTSLSLIDATEFASYLGALALNVNATTGLSGTLSTQASGGSALANFAGSAAPYSATNLVPAAFLNMPTTGTPTSGRYTLAFRASGATSAQPRGDGIATLTLTNTGSVSLAGALADGTGYSAAGKLCADGSVALFTPLYRKLGSLSGELTFAALADSDVSGDSFTWLRPANSLARYFPSGFTLNVAATGAKYAAPASLDFGQGAADALAGNASMVFSDGLLTSAVTKAVSIDPLTGAVKLIPATNTTYKFALTTSTGLFSGTFLHSAGTTNGYRGILLNKGANKSGSGYFLSTPPASFGGSGQAGSVSLDPGGP